MGRNYWGLQWHADSKIQSSTTNKCVFRYHQSNQCSETHPNFRLWCLNCAQRFDLFIARSVVGWKLGRAAENLIDGKWENAFVGWPMNFRLCALLIDAVTRENICVWAKISMIENLSIYIAISPSSWKMTSIFGKSLPTFQPWLTETTGKMSNLCCTHLFFSARSVSVNRS